MHYAKAFPTLLSVVALGFSGYSLYESALKAPELTVFVAPRLDYTDPDRPEAVREVFILPMTIANDGTRTVTVLGISLEARNPRTGAIKKFYAARLGTWGEKPPRPFAPIVLTGRASFTQALQFEPQNGETVPRILDSTPGKYELTLKMDTAAAASLGTSSPRALKFEVEAGEMDYRYFNGNGTMELWVPDYRAPASIIR